MRLAEDAGVHVEGIFSFDLSKNTRKANAAFTGLGRSRRIILGDTLVKNFSEEEIETVFAHELGHYRFGHIRSGIVAGTLSTFAGLFVAARLYEASAAALGFASTTDLAALPLLAIWLSIFGLVTLRRQHDLPAPRASGRRIRGAYDGQTGCLRFGTPEAVGHEPGGSRPHPFVEFMFYSHPPVAKRIRALGTGYS